MLASKRGREYARQIPLERLLIETDAPRTFGPVSYTHLFSAGVKRAYELGAQWFWVMDDDVMVVPEAIERLEPWTCLLYTSRCV